MKRSWTDYLVWSAAALLLLGSITFLLWSAEKDEPPELWVRIGAQPEYIDYFDIHSLEVMVMSSRLSYVSVIGKREYIRTGKETSYRWAASTGDCHRHRGMLLKADLGSEDTTKEPFLENDGAYASILAAELCREYYNKENPIKRNKY